MDEQLPLSITETGGGPEPPARLRFPRATEGGRPFDDDARFFEPWWPGAHALVRRVGRSVEMRTEHLSDPLAVFPELRAGIERLSADGVIVAGTLLALDGEGRPDARLLRRRLGSSGGADEAVEGAFVASDLPWLEGRSLQRRPYVERRAKLAAILTDSEHWVLGRGVVGEGRMLGRAVASLGIDALSARRLDGRWRSGGGGDEWLRLPVADRTLGETRPFLVLMQRLPLAE